MNEHEKKVMSESAARHLADWQTPARRALCDRVMYGDPSIEDLLAISQAELREALDSLPPAAPDNGRGFDGFHAGCCALRVTAYLMQLEKKRKANGGDAYAEVDKDLRIEALSAVLAELIEAIDGSHESVADAKNRARVVLRG